MLGDDVARPVLQSWKASAHWFRHTRGTHALNGRPGENNTVPVQAVQNNLGHASLGTTSGYLTTERDMRFAAMKQFADRRRWERLTMPTGAPVPVWWEKTVEYRFVLRVSVQTCRGFPGGWQRREELGRSAAQG